MKKLFSLLILSLLLLSSARADVLVLVHGYASNAFTWNMSGVSRVLVANGWQDGAWSPSSGKTFYALHLPAKAPLMTQAGILLNQLRGIRSRHPDEPLTLAGHSAGGLVARLAILNGNVAGVSQLVTIASPHLGTPLAIRGLDIAEDKPFFCPGPAWFALKESVGGSAYRYLRDSRGALRDLFPPGYFNLIGWANRQVHPDIRYHAIVRQHGDLLVPSMSQDMNVVPSLKGRVRVWVTHSGHLLNYQDGEILVRILSGQ